MLSPSLRHLSKVAVVLLVAACSDDESLSESSVLPAPAGGGGAGSQAGSNAGQAAPGPNPAPPADPDSSAEPNPDPGTPSNPFVLTAHDPFSTFAADVDSASYENFRRSVLQFNELPSPSAIRTEEFVNHFRYNYPPSNDLEHPFTVGLELAPVPQASTVLLRVGVQGEDRLVDRQAANLVFLVDVSGSMRSDDKLPTVTSMLDDALDVLRPDDTVSIVTYASGAQTVLPPTPVSMASSIRSALNGLSAGGSTAGADGLRLAYNQAEAGWVEGGINHIIMCTDGDFNVGPYTTGQILDIVEQRRASGVTYTALGFGFGNLNDSMMEAVSNAGNGIYRVISGPETAKAYVRQRLLSDVVHIAKDVKIQVEFNPSLVFAYRQIGYENRQIADDDFRDDRVDAGEIGSGHQMTALYELVLSPDIPPTPEGAPALDDGEPVEGEREILPDEIVQVRLRYKRPGAIETDAATEMKLGAGADAIREITNETAFAWAISTLAAAAALDPFHTPERLTAAQSVVNAIGDDAPRDRRDFVQVFQAAASLLPR